jgi:hypothetical protein
MWSAYINFLFICSLSALVIVFGFKQAMPQPKYLVVYINVHRDCQLESIQAKQPEAAYSPSQRRPSDWCQLSAACTATSTRGQGGSGKGNAPPAASYTCTELQRTLEVCVKFVVLTLSPSAIQRYGPCLSRRQACTFDWTNDSWRTVLG